MYTKINQYFIENPFFLAVLYNINLTAELSYFILSFKNSIIFQNIGTFVWHNGSILSSDFEAHF